MTLTKPLVDPKAFSESSEQRYLNKLAPIDEALRKWAKAEGKGGASAPKQVARLLNIVMLCRNWLDNPNGDYRGNDDDRPAVTKLMEDCWKRAQWEQYNASKAKGAQPNLKALDGHHTFEAAAMNKQSYKNEHVGVNSIEAILRGYSADSENITALGAEAKAQVKEIKDHVGAPKALRIADLDQRQYLLIEAYIVQHGIDAEFRQQYYSVSERVSRLLVPGNNCWYSKDGQLFDSHAEAYTNGQALFVVDRYGNWYVDDGQPGVINHSTICRGQPILCGGMLEARQGRLTAITNNSGHYCPDRFQFAAALKTVEKLFTNWETIEVRVTGKKGPSAARTPPAASRRSSSSATRTRRATTARVSSAGSSTQESAADVVGRQRLCFLCTADSWRRGATGPRPDGNASHQRSIACRTSAGFSVSGQWWQAIDCKVTRGPSSAARISAASANVAPVDSSASTGTSSSRGSGDGPNISARSCR
jgi:hypothetical protein